MSKERAKARAERAALAARRAAEENERRRQQRERQQKRARRELAWRRARLWSHGASFHRHREKWAAMVVGVLMAMLLGYLFTGSFTAVLFVALVSVIAGPALYALFFDRSKK